jgi:hypothetical protein
VQAGPDTHVKLKKNNNNKKSVRENKLLSLLY